jgi:hypothetical protein
MSQLSYAFKNDFINAETLYFDNTIMTKKELLEKWIVPVRESWLARRINLAVGRGIKLFVILYEQWRKWVGEDTNHELEGR